jgi:hypothetical protein
MRAMPRQTVNLEVLRPLAEERMKQLQAELESLRAAFPPVVGEGPTKGYVPNGRGRRLSAAERKAISDRMKRMWAERRKKKAR